MNRLLIALLPGGLIALAVYYVARSLFTCTHPAEKLMQYRDEDGIPGWLCPVCRRVRPNIMCPTEQKFRVTAPLPSDRQVAESLGRIESIDAREKIAARVRSRFKENK